MTDDDIEVRETHFQVSLPYGWIGGVTEDPALWQYSARDKDEQLFVSIYEPGESLSEAERIEALRSALAGGLQAERAGAKSDAVELSDPEQTRRGDSLIAGYCGFDPDRKRRFANLTVVAGNVVAGFYFEALDLTCEQFNVDRSRLLDAVRVVP